MKRQKRTKCILSGSNIYLRKICLEDANKDYCRWMNDPLVNCYLESRFCRHTLKTLRVYISEKLGDKSVAFFAIILKDRGRHIGNIKLGPINNIHSFADVGILIGEKDCWEKGYATEAIKLIVEYAFNKLNLHKITAGCYSPNKGSINAFKKAGFLQEGIRRQHCYFKGKYVDDVILGFINPKRKAGK